MAIPRFLGLDKIFNQLVSFVKDDTLFWTQVLLFIYLTLEETALKPYPSQRHVPI